MPPEAYSIGSYIDSIRVSDKIQYTTTQVQPEDYTSGWKVAFILTGLGVSLPMLYLGSEMVSLMGLKNAITAFIISTILLSVLCCITTIIGTRSRLSTYMILRFPFGKQGAKLINFLVGISLLGWFSVALEFLSDAISDTMSMMLGVTVPLWIIILFGSLLITVTTIYGIRTLEKLANIAVPILMIFLLYVLYMAMGNPTTTVELPPPTMSLAEGISALVGSSILVPVLMADFSRYVSTDKQSLLSVLGVTIGTPLVWVIAALLTDKTGEIDIILIMSKFKMVLPAFILIFVSTWVTNATNLYSVALTFCTLTEKEGGYTRITLISGILGTLLALAGFSNYFIEFLNVLAVFSPAIAAIYILDFFVIRTQEYHLKEVDAWGMPALVSWFISSSIAGCVYLEIFSLTGAYYVDAFMIGGILYMILSKMNGINQKTTL